MVVNIKEQRAQRTDQKRSRAADLILDKADRSSASLVGPVRLPTSERLFDVAAELFCERGYAVTTTREIAAAAGIRQASLYYHVSGKEDLLYRICVTSLEELLAEVQAALGEVSHPLERIDVLARTHLRTI